MSVQKSVYHVYMYFDWLQGCWGTKTSC